MFEDLIDESKFKHVEEDCDSGTGEDCIAGSCSTCTGSCQPEALEDELPMSFIKGPDYVLKHGTLESQIYLKYELGHNIQRFYMPAWTYYCLETIAIGPRNKPSGIYRFEEKIKDGIKPNNLKTILIRRPNAVGKLIEHYELVEIY